MKREKVVDRIFEGVAEDAPHISSGMLHRREYLDEENPSNEEQLEADVWAHELLKEKITSIEGVGQFASEEEDFVTDCGEGLGVTVDPLDGSSNIPSNNLVGIIVGIYDGDIPCRGEELVASLYVVFGPLTSMVVAREGEVNEYVIESSPSDEVELHLTSEDMELPEPYVYGFGGNRNWTDEFRDFAHEMERELKLRYGGSMVGDVNQVLHYGGLFSYPERTDAANGKLRLVFEANPMAFIFRNAGGASSNGDKSLLDVEPENLHQRVPVHLGNKEMIEKVEEVTGQK